MASDIQIKMMDIYKQQEQFKQIVINEIEGHYIELVANFKFSDDTLDLKPMHDDGVKNVCVKKFETLYYIKRRHRIHLQSKSNHISESDYKTMEDISMFGAQAAKQSQHKYQDSMKGNPYSGVKHKTKKTRSSKPMLRIGGS